MSICRARRPWILLLAACIAIATAARAQSVNSDATTERVIAATFLPQQIDLHWLNPQKQPYASTQKLADALQAAGRTPLMITNAGIYDQQFSPLGLHIEKGETLRPLNLANGSGNFALKPNAVFAITTNNQAVIVDSTRFKTFAAEHDIRLATQSGPALLLNSQIHPRFLAESQSRKIRNGVGVRTNGEIVFAITKQPMNLHTFARFFRDELNCTNALYLDGTISKLWQPKDSHLHWHTFVGMLSASE